jgi:hypothetical protein
MYLGRGRLAPDRLPRRGVGTGRPRCIPTDLPGTWEEPYSTAMSSLRARVEKGRLVLDEPTTLPEGTVIDLVADDEGDDLKRRGTTRAARRAVRVLEVS